MTDQPSEPVRPEDIDPPGYDQYMTLDEARAVLAAHLDLVKPWDEDPNPEVREFVAQQRRDAEVAFKRLEGFYKIGALPRHRDLPDNALEEIRARNLGLPWPKPSLWARLTGKA
ncbi:MAG: hypothetical protein EON52_08845 [Actinomycetales bacterium]|nr:MAG: hypothetical protein EON52_08845 [Actinomycetales bacterium]